MGKVARIRFDERADLDRWQEYVRGRSDSHCTDLAEWRLLFRQLYGFEDYSYVFLEDGEVRGALSLYHIRSPFMGRMLVTCPYFGYGGLYWEDEAARDALLDTAESVARQLAVDYIEIRSTKELPPPFQANRDFAEFHLDLEASAEETWKSRLSSNVRQNIRKSRKQEMRFSISTDHRPCYRLLQQTLRAHGTPFHGERFFRLLTTHLGERLRFAEVWQADKLVAAGIVVRYRGTIITPYIGSLARYRSLRPNYLQYWSLVEHCFEEGIGRFEMGRSPRGSTHAQFKQKWGCEELPVFYNYLVVRPEKGYRSVSQPSPIYRLATRVWKRLPLTVTAAVGPRLFRYIP